MPLLDCRGFSMTEVATTLVAMTILSGVTAPAINDYVEDAKLVRARHDTSTLGVSLVRLFSDVGGERLRPGGWATYDVLVGAGSPPASASEDTIAWVTPAGDPAVGSLDDQLIANGATYTTYRAGLQRGWRGAYLQRSVTPDPWGHRYAVNVRAVIRSSSDIFVVSAGPDGTVVSPFEADGLTAGGDDVISLISSARVGQ
jgi:hypothetical protein